MRFSFLLLDANSRVEASMREYEATLFLLPALVPEFTSTTNRVRPGVAADLTLSAITNFPSRP